jgi:O-antigen ligase
MIGQDLNPGQLDRLVAWTFGLAPAALFLLTWSDDFTPLQQTARAFALPVLAAELAVVLVSFGEGYRLGKLQPLPVVLIAALGILAWGTAIAAPNPVPALLRTGTWTIHLLFGLALVNLRRHGMLDFDRLLRAVLTGFLLIFALLIAFIATTDQSPLERTIELPAFANVRWFGEYVVSVVGLCAIGFLRRDKFYLFTAAAAFAMAFWTGSRGAVLAPLAGFMLCTVLFREFRSVSTWRLFLLSGFVGFALALGLDALVPIGDRGPDDLARFGSSGRIELWQYTIREILDQPWFGHGEGQFRFMIGTYSLAQPHNVVLQVLYTWGFIGGLLCLALAIWAAPRFLQAPGIEAAPFRCAAIMVAVHALIDGTLYHVHSTSLFALCCAAAIAAGYPRAPGAGRNRSIESDDEKNPLGGRIHARPEV